MSKETKIEVGDWVSFMRDNAIVIGLVLYKETDSINSTWAYTSCGTTCTDSVLEVRKP